MSKFSNFKIKCPKSVEKPLGTVGEAAGSLDPPVQPIPVQPSPPRHPASHIPSRSLLHPAPAPPAPILAEEKQISRISLNLLH